MDNPAKSEAGRLLRDRFIAFAFASCDLFLEIAPNGRISYCVGAASAITGKNEKDLIETDWQNLFAEEDRPVLKSMISKASDGKRKGPVLANINPNAGARKKVFLNAIKMPGSDNTYMTIGHNSILMNKIAGAVREAEDGEIMDKNNFLYAAQDAINASKSMGQDVDITFLDLNASSMDKYRYGDERWEAMKEEIAKMLKSRSVDGQTAAEVSDGRYSVIHDSGFDAEVLFDQVQQIAKDKDPTGGGLDVFFKSIEASSDGLSGKETTRALLYTINEFERKGDSLSVDDLNGAFKDYMSENAEKIKEFENFIKNLDFKLHFQPIVDLHKMEASHYEMLCRFSDGDTLEWIMFGEDIGMASEFDIAVCERAIKYISRVPPGTKTRFAINLSGQSIEDENFFNDLKALLEKHDNIAERIIFEITESSDIQNLELVNGFIQELQSHGYRIALDDFGAGSASFRYLQNLNVDYVKIDGQYIRKILTSQRDLAMVKNLTQMCLDLNIKVIAEFVENMEEAKLLRDIGVHYGQGWLFGKAEPKPSFVPTKELVAFKSNKKE